MLYSYYHALCWPKQVQDTKASPFKVGTTTVWWQLCETYLQQHHLTSPMRSLVVLQQHFSPDWEMMDDAILVAFSQEKISIGSYLVGEMNWSVSSKLHSFTHD